VSAAVSPGLPGAPLLVLDGVSRVYGQGDAEVRALDNVHLTIHVGEFVALMGPSGSGKSTCLNVLGCLDEPTSGSYRFLGVEVTQLDADQRAMLRRTYLGFVFQGFNLLPRTSAVENVELPLLYTSTGVVEAGERRRRARAALEAVGLTDRAEHHPNQLSGGQQQRVAIARALVTQPSVLLADEPTGNLDSHNGEAVMQLLRDLHADGATICMVTHDPRYAAHATRSVHLFDGRVVPDDHAGTTTGVGGAAAGARRD
jgi:putative ABC transport system ATP-binding protein